MAIPINNIHKSFGDKTNHISVIMPPPDTAKIPIFKGIGRFIKLEILGFISITVHYSIYLIFYSADSVT